MLQAVISVIAALFIGFAPGVSLAKEFNSSVPVKETKDTWGIAGFVILPPTDTEGNSVESGKIKVLGSFHGTPAEKAGISSGDEIISIDKVKVATLAFNKVLILGHGTPVKESGTTIEITFEHMGTLKTVNIVRINAEDILPSIEAFVNQTGGDYIVLLTVM